MITFVTCWYILKAKFDRKIYEGWMKNLLLNVRCFNLVVYSDEESSKMLLSYIKGNERIKLVIKPLTEFYNYKYKDYWIKNHEENHLLKKITNWKLHMLWSEKISFVNDAFYNKYFDTEWYGWCDIGYFRGRHNDIPVESIKKWPNREKILSLNKEHIYYANICPSVEYMNYLIKLIVNKNAEGLPRIHIPHEQISIAGGFFLTHKKNLRWWHKTYDDKLQLYFKNNRLVKDDQIIILDCVMNNFKRFILEREDSHLYDNWFMFQRKLI